MRVLLVTIFLLTGASPVWALTEAQVKGIIDVVKTKCDQANTTFGRYVQGIETPATIPTKGVPVPFDVTRKPSDEPLAWQDWGVDNTVVLLTDWQFRVDRCLGPNGTEGYEIRATQRDQDKLVLITTGETYRTCV